MFNVNQIVRGKVVGRFQVVKVETRKADGVEIVTVREISPEGYVSKSKMKFPAELLAAE